jgi:hypothetical protein
VADATGTGAPGQVLGGSTWVAGVSGQALRFNGSTGYALVPDAPDLRLSGPMTVAAWVRPERVATQYVVKKALQGTTNGFELGLASSGRPFLRFNHASSGDGFRLDGSASYPTDGTTWTLLVGTYDGTTMRFYVDGVLQGSRPGPSAIGTSSLGIGIGAESDGTRAVRGAVDDVRLYGRALSGAEVSTLFTDQAP